MADVSTISGSSSIATKPVPSPELPLFALVAADVAVVLADAELADAEHADAELANADVAGDMLLDWLFVAPSPVPVSGKPPAMTGDAFNAAATIANYVIFVPNRTRLIHHNNRFCPYFIVIDKKFSSNKKKGTRPVGVTPRFLCQPLLILANPC